MNFCHYGKRETLLIISIRNSANSLAFNPPEQYHSDPVGIFYINLHKYIKEVKCTPDFCVTRVSIIPDKNIMSQIFPVVLCNTRQISACCN